MTVRVVLVDDQPLVRSGLRVLIETTRDMEVVGEAGSGVDALMVVAETRPDVVVMDIRMPGMNGVEATRRVVSTQNPPRVLVLTTFDDEYLHPALEAGASGFLVKDMALDDILGAIRIVAEGDALLAPRVTRRLIEEYVRRPERAPSYRSSDIVTAREREVLTLVGRGRTNAEIAAELHISHATAKAHVARLLTKLDARDRIQLVVVAYDMGLVTPNNG